MDSLALVAYLIVDAKETTTTTDVAYFSQLVPHVVNTCLKTAANKLLHSGRTILFLFQTKFIMGKKMESQRDKKVCYVYMYH